MIQKPMPYNRLIFLKLTVYAIGVIFVFRLVNLQIMKHSYFKNIAERNKTQIISRTAPRGRIYTKDKILIAGNKPSFTLVYFPSGRKSVEYIEKMAQGLSRHLGSSLDAIKKKLFFAMKKGAPVKISEGLTNHSMFLISELKTLYRGIEIITEAQRFYPFGNSLSHLIGYIGKMSPGEWKYLCRDKNYTLDSYTGKAGIEKRFEKELKGKNGGIYLEVDSKGRLMQILESKKSVRGLDINLTIDSKIQAAAEKGLKSTVSGKGAVVAIDPRNGAVLAFSSMPDFDLNAFIDSVSKGKKLINIPEFNSAVQGAYPPASIFKIIVAAAAFEAGKLDLNEKVFCPGYFDAGSRIFKCWKKKGHGKMDFYDGFAHSCDVFYYINALKTGPLNIERYARKFRLGMPTGIKVVNENSGNVFGPSKRALKKSYWFIGDTLNLSIGQGEMLVTPIQMAQVIAAIANGGKFWQPYYIDEIKNIRGYKTFTSRPKLLSSLNLKDSTWIYLRNALKKVVLQGTGYAAKIRGVDVFGKTGTAQNPHGNDHAWFVAYAQFENEEPEIAVCVLVEYGEHGSSAAAPIAKKVIEAALRDKLPKRKVRGKKPKAGIGEKINRRKAEGQKEINDVMDFETGYLKSAPPNTGLMGLNNDFI